MSTRTDCDLCSAPIPNGVPNARVIVTTEPEDGKVVKMEFELCPGNVPRSPGGDFCVYCAVEALARKYKRPARKAKKEKA
jgi:hypothetical protein